MSKTPDAPVTMSKSEVLEKNILALCSSLSAVGTRAEKAATPVGQASTAATNLAAELQDASGRLRERHPRLGECLESAGEFLSDVGNCYSTLSASVATETAAPLKKMSQDCAKRTKKQKKHLDKLQASVESAKTKVKLCRDKGVTTNMVKLMELEEERDSLQAEFESTRAVSTCEFEARLAQLEAEGIATMLSCISAHKTFFQAGLARIEEMEATIGTLQRAVNHQRLRHIPGQQYEPSESRRNRQALTLPAPLRALPPAERAFFERGAEFQVTQLGKKQRRVTIKVMLHLFPPELHITDAKTQTTAVRSFEELLQVVRAPKAPRCVELSWKATEKPMQLQSTTMSQRERLYECLTFALSSTTSLPKREEELKLFVGSWNMGDAPPPADVEELGKWIPSSGYDLYAIGVQECEYKPKQTGEDADVQMDESKCEADWFGRILLYLGDQFVRVCSLSLMSMRLIVIVRRSKWFCISNVKKSYEACGIANIVGNKGAVAVALQYNETRIAFVNSHLAAHLNKYEDRNQDYRYICSNLNLAKESTGSASASLLNHYHYLFWFGDLNYRLEADQQEVISLVRQSRFDDLLLHDQLHRERVWGKTFAGFSEGPLNFPPTYRYIRGVRTYNEEKGRVPSWCDRILWRTLPGYTVEQDSYGSCDEIMTSDHSPILGLFTLTTRRANWPHVPGKTAYIVISSLQASGLCGASDKAPEASVSLVGPYNVTATTSVAAKSDTPAWTDMVVLEVLTSNEEFVARETVSVVVHDNKRKDLADFGQASFSLREACQACSSLSVAPPPPSSSSLTVSGNSSTAKVEVNAGESGPRSGVYPVDFACKLLYKGVYVGTVKGQVAVVWGAENVPKEKNTVMGSHVDQERGMLLTKKKKKKQWVKRWFEIGHGTLNAFQSDSTSKVWKTFPLAGAHVYQLPEAERPAVFRLVYRKDGGEEHLLLCAGTVEEMEHWLNAIIEASGLVAPVATAQEPKAQTATSPRESVAVASAGAEETHNSAAKLAATGVVQEKVLAAEGWVRPLSPESSTPPGTISPVAARAVASEGGGWSNKRASAWASNRGRQAPSPLLGARRPAMDSPNARSNKDYQSPLVSPRTELTSSFGSDESSADEKIVAADDTATDSANDSVGERGSAAEEEDEKGGEMGAAGAVPGVTEECDTAAAEVAEVELAELAGVAEAAKESSDGEDDDAVAEETATETAETAADGAEEETEGTEDLAAPCEASPLAREESTVLVELSIPHEGDDDPTAA